MKSLLYNLLCPSVCYVWLFRFEFFVKDTYPSKCHLKVYYVGYFWYILLSFYSIIFVSFCMFLLWKQRFRKDELDFFIRDKEIEIILNWAIYQWSNKAGCLWLYDASITYYCYVTHVIPYNIIEVRSLSVWNKKSS